MSQNEFVTTSLQSSFSAPLQDEHHSSTQCWPLFTIYGLYCLTIALFRPFKEQQVYKIHTDIYNIQFSKIKSISIDPDQIGPGTTSQCVAPVGQYNIFKYFLLLNVKTSHPKQYVKVKYMSLESGWKYPDRSHANGAWGSTHVSCLKGVRQL